MVEVRQEDREAYLAMSMLPELDAADVRAGLWDKVTGLQAFARHRIAAENAALERAAKVADELGGVRPKTADQEPFRAQHTRANTIATAIRAILEKNNERG